MDNYQISQFGIIALFILTAVLFLGLALVIGKMIRPQKPTGKQAPDRSFRTAKLATSERRFATEAIVQKGRSPLCLLGIH